MIKHDFFFYLKAYFGALFSFALVFGISYKIIDFIVKRWTKNKKSKRPPEITALFIFLTVLYLSGLPKSIQTLFKSFSIVQLLSLFALYLADFFLLHGLWNMKRLGLLVYLAYLVLTQLFLLAIGKLLLFNLSLTITFVVIVFITVLYPYIEKFD